MKKFIVCFILALSLLSLCACGNNVNDNTASTATPTTEKEHGKYADSKYLGSWYNADSPEDELICTLNDDGSATFKNDDNALWEESQTGITITTTIEGISVNLEGYFVIAGDGFVARATEANMHYLDEGGVLQLEIMLTENTCVDCIKK